MFPMSKLVIHELPPIFAVALRFTLLSLLVLPFLKPAKGHYFRLFLTSVVFMAAPVCTQSIALQWVGPTVAAFSSQLPPLLLILVGVFFFGEKITFYQVCGLFLSLIGVYLVLDSPEISFRYWIAPFFLLISIVTSCLGTLQVRSAKTTPFQTILYCYLFASPQMILASYFFEGNTLNLFMQATPPWVYLMTLLMGVLSIIANSIWTDLFQKHNISKIAPLALTLPVFSLITGHFMLHENIHTKALIGGGIALLGVMVVTIYKKPLPPEPSIVK